MINLKQMREKARDQVDLFYVDILEKANNQIEDLLEQEPYCNCEVLAVAYETMDERALYQYSKDYVKTQMAGHDEIECRMVGILNYMGQYMACYGQNVPYSELADSMELENAFEKFFNSYSNVMKTGTTIEMAFKWATKYADSRLGYFDIDTGDCSPIDERGFDD